MLYQIYNSEDERVCLLSTNRTDEKDVEQEIRNAFISASSQDVYKVNVLEYALDILEYGGIERVYTEDLTVNLS